MKRRILALLLAVLTLTALTAAAFAADTPETLGAFNLKGSKGYTLTVVGEGSVTGGFYAGANRFTLTCDGLDGNYSLVLLLKEGAAQADGTEGIPTPTENNLQYIDQQNIAARKATFTLFPKSLERGVYNVYVSTDKVTLKKVASFEYNEKPKYTLGDVNDDGAINIIDVSSVLSYIASLEEFSANQFEAADVCKDKGVVDIRDVAGILYYIAYGKFE